MSDPAEKPPTHTPSAPSSPTVPPPSTISLPPWLRRTIFALTVFLALLYTPVLRPIFIVGLGFGKPRPLPITAFPDLQCRRLHHPELQACEDMYFSDSTRQLYLACSDPRARMNWLPNMGRLDAKGRSRRDRVVVLRTDSISKGGEGLDVRVLDVKGWGQERELHVVGFGVKEDARGEKVDLFLVNNEPGRDAVTGELLLDEGANSTIEQFRVEGRKGTEMRFVRSWVDEKIATPNNVAVVDLENFFITNDHGYAKTGMSFHMSPFVDTGNVVHCSSKHGCTEVATGLAFPNGLAKGPDGRIYVPSAVRGDLHVYSYDEKNMSAPLKKDEIISTRGYFVDNLSQDGDGTLWAASSPASIGIPRQLMNGPQWTPAATAFRINRSGDAWEVVKVAEDKDGAVLPGTTTVVHDSVKGRLFFSGIMSPFITVCDRDPAKAKVKLEKWT